jgi:hypothetical protein
MDDLMNSDLNKGSELRKSVGTGYLHNKQSRVNFKIEIEMEKT